MMQTPKQIALAIAVLAAGVLACSDTLVCGDGTQLSDGTCVPSAVCTNGTRLNLETRQCEIDPAACQGGTVLVDNRCQDPSAGLVIDVEEGAEPNGFDGTFVDNKPAREIGFRPAGAIALRPAGDRGVTVHGCVTPSGDRPDIDAYTLRVDGPTLIHVSVDGVGGLTGGFAIFPGPDVYTESIRFPSPMEGWLRAGVTLSSDTVKREVFLPVAGEYTVYVSDSRTLLPLIGTASTYLWNFSLPAYGDPGGASCYYMSIEQRIPEVLPWVSTGTASETLRFFAVPSFQGFIQLIPRYDSPGYPGRENTPYNLELLLMNAGRLRVIGSPANAWRPGREERGSVFFGSQPGDIVIVDDRGSLGQFDYTLVRNDVPADPLPVGGEVALSTVKGTRAMRESASYPYFPTLDLNAVNLHYFDAPSSLLKVDLHVSLPAQASLVDGDGNHIGNWGNALDWWGDSAAFTDYSGLVRVPKPGRYYFLSVNPRSAAGDPFSVSASVAARTAASITINSQSGDVPLGAERRVLAYNAGIDAWHQVNATGSDMGNVVVDFYDPQFAFGRLDELAARDAFDQPTPQPSEALLLHSVVLPEDGSGPVTHLIAGHSQMLALVGAAQPGVNATFNLSLSSHPTAKKLGLLVPPTSAAVPGFVLTGAPPSDVGRFSFEAPERSIVTVTATPRSGFDRADNRLYIATLAPDGTDFATWDSPAPGSEVARFRVNTWDFFHRGPISSPLEVRSADPFAAGSFDVAIAVQPPFYDVAPSATAFRDICSAETMVELTADGVIDYNGVPFPSQARGLSSPITAPAGFTFYGSPVSRLVVSACGFVSFDDSLNTGTDIQAGQVNLTPAVGDCGSGAYDWSVYVCAKQEGSRLVIQWRGGGWSDRVDMQAILDADGSIEYVYGPGHRTLWLTGAQVQDRSGVDSTPLEGAMAPRRGRAVRFFHR